MLQLLRERGALGVTNVELSHIGLKYTSRITELRHAGYNIVARCEDRNQGLYSYRLEEPPLLAKAASA